MKAKSYLLIGILLILATSANLYSGTLFPAHTLSALSSLGPFQIYSRDSASSLRLQVAAQLRTVYENLDQGDDKCRSDRLYMEARRLRIILSGMVASPSLTWRLHLSMAPGSIELMDFFFDYRYKPELQFRFGQFKIPYTRYRIQSFQRLTFADWSIVTRYFGAERQQGFAFHNGYEKPPARGYVLGIFSGVNARASHAVGLPRLFNQSLTNPSNLANPAVKSEFHPELVLHLSYNANVIDLASENDRERGGWRYSLALSAAWDLDPEQYYDFTGRISPEFLLKYRGFSASLIGYAAFMGLGGEGQNRLAMLASLVQAAYCLNQAYDISARYGFIDFTEDLLLNIRTYTGKNSPLQREHELAFGINHYIIGHSLKWQNDFIIQVHCYEDHSMTDYIYRSQMQLGF